MSKIKNVAKNEIVLHDPYSNALCPPPSFGQCLKENVFFLLMSSLSQQCMCIQAEQWCSKSLAVNFLYHLGLDISQCAAKWLQGEGIARKITDEVDRVVSKLKKYWRIIRSTSKIEYSFSQHIFPAQSHQEKNLINQFQWWGIIPYHTRMSLQAIAQDVTVEERFTSNLLLANQTSSDKSTFRVIGMISRLVHREYVWRIYLPEVCQEGKRRRPNCDCQEPKCEQ